MNWRDAFSNPGGFILLGLLAFAAGADGGGLIKSSAGLPEATEDEHEVDRGFAKGEKFAEMLGRRLRALNEQGQALRERFEGLVGIYRLLKAMGMSDAAIAKLVADQSRLVLGREISERNFNPADARRVMDSIQDTIIKGAQEVDTRLDLGGEFTRRVRDGVQATKSGREDALIVTEHGFVLAREQLEKLLGSS